MIVYAVNVNSGGGKVLLDRLLIQNPFESTTAAFLDTRYTAPSEFKGKKKFFSIFSRLFAEKKLHEQIDLTDQKESVLFFGNLPPFKKPKIKSYLYLQNCFLTGQVPLPTDSFRELFRNWAESWILKLCYNNVDEIWVQTEWMKDLTVKQCPGAVIKIKPFLPLLPPPVPKLHKTYKFIYVGSLSTNKGLSQFLLALKDLDSLLKQKIEVCVVLNNNFTEASDVRDFATHLQNISLRVKCRVSRQELFKIYESSSYLVVTSLYESYYLPAYEASHFGCKIIVRDDAEYIKNSDVRSLHFVSIKKINLIDYLE